MLVEARLSPRQLCCRGDQWYFPPSSGSNRWESRQNRLAQPDWGAIPHAIAPSPRVEFILPGIPRAADSKSRLTHCEAHLEVRAGLSCV